MYAKQAPKKRNSSHCLGLRFSESLFHLPCPKTLARNSSSSSSANRRISWIVFASRGSPSRSLLQVSPPSNAPLFLLFPCLKSSHFNTFLLPISETLIASLHPRVLIQSIHETWLLIGCLSSTIEY